MTLKERKKIGEQWSKAHYALENKQPEILPPIIYSKEIEKIKNDIREMVKKW